MARRLAFLIGNKTFSEESGLSTLQGPENDVLELARLLGDRERGMFEVHKFLDKASYEVLPDIEQALSDAAIGDFFLIYYSGHGKRDRSDRLCLATKNTRQGALIATSIHARQLRDLVEQSKCDQVLLLLDCCYSGAVEDGLRGNVSDELQVVEDARGFYIMTASTAIQPARETAIKSGVVMGRFTAALVDGIESGAADQGYKGKILLSDLRQHLGRTVTGQTPQFFDRRASGDPLISLSPATAAPLLDAEMLADLDAEQWYRRRGAVTALAGVLKDGNQSAQGAARSALQRRLLQERDYIVRSDLEAALNLAPPNPQPLSPPVEVRSANPDVDRRPK